MSTRCPCCGTVLELVASATWHKHLKLLETPYGSLYLTNLRGRMFDLLWHARPDAVVIERIVMHLWTTLEGPPMAADGNVRVMAGLLRRQLVPLGIALLHGEKGREGYRLAIMHPDEAAAIATRIRNRSGWKGR